MSEKTFVCCDLCGRVLKGDLLRQQTTGIVVTFGYSKQGWGNRRNWLDVQGVVCRDCAASVKKKAQEMSEFIANLKNTQHRNG